MFFRTGDWVKERTLVHGQELVLLLGQSNQFIGLLSGGGEGLLTDNCCKKTSALMRSQLLHVAVQEAYRAFHFRGPAWPRRNANREQW